MSFDPEYLAAESERLLKDNVLNHALDEMRTEAIDALLGCAASDMVAVTKWQQKVAAIDDIRGQLERWMNAKPENTGSYA